MIDLALDKTGDLLIEDYDLKLIDGIDQVIQNVSIRLRFFLGEWFLDIESGIPYYQDFFIKAPNQIRIESLIKEEILDTDGINEITAFEAEFDSSLREFSVNFSAQADEGEIELEVSVP